MLPLPPAAENLAMTVATSFVASCAARPLTPCLQWQEQGGVPGRRRVVGGGGGGGGRGAVVKGCAAGDHYGARRDHGPAAHRELGARAQSPGHSRLHQQVAAALGAQHQRELDPRYRHWAGAGRAGRLEGAGATAVRPLTAAGDSSPIGSRCGRQDRRAGQVLVAFGDMVCQQCAVCGGSAPCRGLPPCRDNILFHCISAKPALVTANSSSHDGVNPWQPYSPYLPLHVSAALSKNGV